MSVKISELTASSAVTSNDFVPIVDYETATTKRAPANQILDYITGSTFNSLTVTSLTSSNVTASRIDVDQIYANDVIGGNISGDAAGLTNIPASGIEGSIQYNVSGVLTGDSYLTYDSENLKLISQNADFISVTVDDISGTTAQFTTITSSNLIVSGGNAIFYEMAEIGDNAYVLYNSSIDKLVAFPGLYVTGAITASTALSASNIGATTAQFTNLTSSAVSSSKLELNTGTRTSLNYGAYISGVPYNGPLVRLDAAGNTSHIGGNANLNNGGLQVVFSSGYTGTGITFAGDFENSNQSAGNNLKFDTSYANPVGNSGFNGFAAGTTDGLNVGGYCEAANGNVSIGQVGKSITSKVSGTNIGVIGVARNTDGGSTEIGGYFGLNNSTPVFSSSALTADNGTSTAPIFIARDNGSEVFTISDGGNTIISGNLTVTGSDSSIAFSASNSSHWTGSPPSTLQEALNRIAAAIYSGITGSIA